MTDVKARAVVDAAMTEAQLFESVRDHLNTFGWLWYHTYDSRRSNGGFPDIIAVKDGRLLAVELKSMKGQVTPEQRSWQLAIWICGGGTEMHTWRPSDLSSGEIERVLRGSL